MVNSRQKGKRGEREAVAYLKQLGFAEVRRSQQYNGIGRGDVVMSQFPALNIEVKFGYAPGVFNIGTQLWEDACQQAAADADGNTWCVLWKPLRIRQWRVTCPWHGPIVTICGDDSIKRVFLQAGKLSIKIAQKLDNEEH